MKKKSSPPTVPTEPSEDEIRDYAYHLYEQSGRIPGRDVDNWFEACACLKANIPVHHSRLRLHRHLQGLAVDELCAIATESHNVAI